MNDKFTIVFSYYSFNYGLRLSRYIGSRHFSPEEQKLIYRPVALKGLINTMNWGLCKLHCIAITKVTKWNSHPDSDNIWDKSNHQSRLFGGYNNKMHW
jgi:hypothetical protein